MWEAIRRQTDMVSQLNFIIKELKGAKLKAQRAAERLREMVAESGPCGELTVLRVPLPLNPAILLAGKVCTSTRVCLWSVAQFSVVESGPCRELTVLQVSLPLNPPSCLQVECAGHMVYVCGLWFKSLWSMWGANGVAGAAATQPCQPASR